MAAVAGTQPWRARPDATQKRREPVPGSSLAGAPESNHRDPLGARGSRAALV